MSTSFCGLTALGGHDCAGTAGLGTGRHPVSAQQALHLVQLQPRQLSGSQFHPRSLPGVLVHGRGAPPGRRDDQLLSFPS